MINSNGRTPFSGRSSRTPLFSKVRELIDLATAACRHGSPPADELLERSREMKLTRRAYLAGSAAALATLAGGTSFARGVKSASPRATAGGTLPKIVVIGGGIAGLNATYILKRAGIPATLYSADRRIGGRMFSITGLIGAGLTTELGGEFIDTDHYEMLALVAEFGLNLLNSSGDPLSTTYYLGGRHYTDAQLLPELIPLAYRFNQDLSAAPANVSYLNRNPQAVYLDRTNLQKYLERVGATGPVFQLIKSAYVGEEGLDLDRQSALGFLLQFGSAPFEPVAPINLLGNSDQLFKVQGGNQQVVQELAARVADRLVTGRRLARIKSRGAGYVLSFETDNGPSHDVAADVVIMAIPFSTLRDVEVDVPLPAVKRLAIERMSYGTNSKIQVGFKTRFWRQLGSTGTSYTDAAYGSSWDSTLGEPGVEGGLTLYHGGAAGLATGKGSAADQAAHFLPSVNAAFPGAYHQPNGRAGRAQWPENEFVKGSYSTYGVGEFTAFGGAQFFPVGNLHFAGEHCSYPFYGYMNGAATTGRLAAQDVLAKVMS